MRWFVGAVAVAMGAWCPAQDFSSPFSSYDVESGILSLLPDLDGPAGSEVWEFRVKGRKTAQRVIDYIHVNPVRRGLCESPQDHTWSSAASWCETGSSTMAPNAMEWW